jgi:hypothetical protein
MLSLFRGASAPTPRTAARDSSGAGQLRAGDADGTHVPDATGVRSSVCAWLCASRTLACRAIVTGLLLLLLVASFASAVDALPGTGRAVWDEDLVFLGRAGVDANHPALHTRRPSTQMSRAPRAGILPAPTPPALSPCAPTHARAEALRAHSGTTGHALTCVRPTSRIGEGDGSGFELSGQQGAPGGRDDGTTASAPPSTADGNRSTAATRAKDDEDKAQADKVTPSTDKVQMHGPRASRLNHAASV